ncbi:MAG TPA: gephyrin-like molybdotransferase Glp [Myxococcales bacterium]|nr:gephyrin-like molybdotransferase Glp [Myxococcales bacterium]
MITPLEEALAAIAARARPLEAEAVPLAEAHGRVLAEGVRALRDQPATDVSMMDGYALRAADARQPLRVAGEIAAGDAPWSRPLQPGEAARIFTGAPLPPGADCVVMQEQAAREGDSLRVQQPPKAGQHIRRRGEELTAGGEALPPGRTLDGSDLALAAACGASVVRAHRRPRVAVLCTGSELVPLGATPPPGKIVETNGLTLAALCREAGAEVERLGIAPDTVEQIAGKLGAAKADILVTTGGASVGDHDHAQAALERLGGSLVFHSVAIRPGKPILFGQASGGRLVFGLPGNPAAATLGFELFVRLAIRLLSGDGNPSRPRARARLRGAVSRVKGLTHFPRGRVGASGSQLVFTPAAQQSSMQISSWSGANAVAMIPPGEGLVPEGTEVDVLLVAPLSPA